MSSKQLVRKLHITPPEGRGPGEQVVAARACQAQSGERERVPVQGVPVQTQRTHSMDPCGRCEAALWAAAGPWLSCCVRERSSEAPPGRCPPAAAPSALRRLHLALGRAPPPLRQRAFWFPLSLPAASPPPACPCGSFCGPPSHREAIQTSAQPRFHCQRRPCSQALFSPPLRFQKLDTGTMNLQLTCEARWGAQRRFARPFCFAVASAGVLQQQHPWAAQGSQASRGAPGAISAQHAGARAAHSSGGSEAARAAAC